MLGTIYQQGIGADTAELKNEEGNDETGAHVEQMYNSDGEFISLLFFSTSFQFIFHLFFIPSRSHFGFLPIFLYGQIPDPLPSNV